MSQDKVAWVDLEGSHALLEPTPVDDGSRLQKAELRSEDLLLGLHLHE